MSGICGMMLRSGSAQLVTSAIRAMGHGLAIPGEESFTFLTDAAPARNAAKCAVGVSARLNGQEVFSDARFLAAVDFDLTNAAELRKLTGQADGSLAMLLARLYERFGVECFEKLHGSFSAILVDRHENRLVAAVDGFGMRRLAYYENGGSIWIASRITALAQTGEIPLEINPPALAQMINGSATLGPGTIFKGVFRIAPGSILVHSEGGTRVQTYWDMRYTPASRAGETQLSRELEGVVERAVHRHRDAGIDAPVGAFLSGGTDSSTIVGMMSRNATGSAKAYSIGFEEEAYNELEYAVAAARKFAADHHCYKVSPEDCFEALPNIIRSFDEPFGNSSAVPTYFCARLAANQGIKTMLAGDGGDELFGGNEWYATDKIFQLYGNIPSVLRKALIEPALAVAPFGGSLVRRGRGYVRRANMPMIDRVMSFMFLQTHAPSDVFHPDFAAALGQSSVLDVPRRHFAAARADADMDRLLYVDVKITLADNDLPKVTCMSELAGVRVRFPYLDREVAEFSAAVPAHLKVKKFQKRYLFKKAFGQLLPQEIIQKKKHGFGIPVSMWLRTYQPLREMAHDLLLSQRARERGYFSRSFIEELLRHHDADETSFYGDTVWTFAALELWHRQVLDVQAEVVQ